VFYEPYKGQRKRQLIEFDLKTHGVENSELATPVGSTEPNSLEANSSDLKGN
jgi:hypothetical protein